MDFLSIDISYKTLVITDNENTVGFIRSTNKYDNTSLQEIIILSIFLLQSLNMH